MRRALRDSPPVTKRSAPPGVYAYQTGTASGPRSPSAMLTTATCVSARKASRSSLVMASDMRQVPLGATTYSVRASAVHHPRRLVREAGHGAPRDQLERGRHPQALAEALGEPARERARVDAPRRVILEPNAQGRARLGAAHDLVLRRGPRHLRELVEDERHVDGQHLDLAHRYEVAHPSLVEEAAVGLAAGARCQVPAHHVLEVVAQKEVVLLEHGDDQVAALAVAAGPPRAPVDHLYDGEVLGQVRPVALVAGAAEEWQRLQAGARHQILLRRVVAGDGEVQVALGVEPQGARRVGVGAGDVAEEAVHVGPDAPPHLDHVADVLLTHRGPRGEVQHAERLDAVAEVPAAGVHAEGVRVGEAHAGAEPPAPAAARRGRVVHLQILPRPQDERRAPAGAGGRAEPHAGRERRAAVVAEGRVLLLALAELCLHRRRDAVQVVEPAEIGATEPGSLELAAEERHRDRPHAVELAGEALRLQPAEPLQRHRLDRGVVVAALAHRFTTASAKPGGPAVSGTSPSGTSATSIWISTVALRRSASVRQSASASAGGRTVPARKVARS